MVVCQFYLKGDCRFGDRCRNEHPAKSTYPTRTVCPYFLRGNCRFGQGCKFEHPGAAGGGFGTHQSTFKQSEFGSGQGRGTSTPSFAFKSSFGRDQNPFGVLAQQPTNQPFGSKQPSYQQRQAPQNTDPSSQIQQIVQKDMEMWMTSKQWPLSCYSYHKEEPCLSGLTDFSFEEIRLEAVKANASGTGAAYQQGLKELLAKCIQRKLQLKGMSASQLHQEIKSAEIESMSSNSSAFGSGSHPSVFGGATQSLSGSGPQPGSGVFGTGAIVQPSGLFGAAVATGQSQGVFGGTTSQSNSLFGSMPPGGQSSSVFGSASPTGQFGTVASPSRSSTFGQGTQSGSLFGSSAASTQPGGTFGAKTTQSVGLLGAAPTGAQSVGLFGSSVSSTQPGGIFGAKTTEGVGLLGAAPAGATPSVGLFGSSIAAQPMDGASTTARSSAQPNPSSILGVAPTQPATVPPQAGSSGGRTLTCSEEDLVAFRADSFVLGNIPECAPPPELC